MPTTNTGPSVSSFTNEVPLRGTFDSNGKLIQILGSAQNVAFDPANVAITGGTVNGASLQGSVPFNPANVAITGGTISGVLPSVATRIRAKTGASGKLPSLMATPPTIGPQTTTQTLSVLSAWNSGNLVLKSARWAQVGANARAAPVTTDYQADGTVLFANSASFEFETSAPIVEIDALFDGFRIFIDEYDGKGWQLAGQISSGNTGVEYFVPINFSAAATPRKPRGYRIDCGGSTQLFGVRTSIADVVYKNNQITTLKGVLLGDSFVEGTGATATYFDGYGNRLGWLLGIDNMVCSGSGGTGLVNSNGIRVPYGARLFADVISQSPDIAIIQCSQNDLAYAAPLVQAALAKVLDTVLAAKIIPLVIGVWNVPAANATASALNQALAATAALKGVTFLDWYSYITGTGKVGTVTGDGNADFTVSADGTHPSDFGHQYRASRLRSSVIAWINTI